MKRQFLAIPRYITLFFFLTYSFFVNTSKLHSVYADGSCTGNSITNLTISPSTGGGGDSVTLRANVDTTQITGAVYIYANLGSGYTLIGQANNFENEGAGVYSITMHIPSYTPAGTHSVAVYGSRNLVEYPDPCSNTASITVTEPSVTTSPSQNFAPANDPFCTPGDEKSGISTALGCIDVSSPDILITTILKIATGLGGGIALALILYGTFIVTTSAGMPDKLKAGSEIITSAIIGLIFILLSIFLVNLIGINILGIPGLT